MKYFDDINVGDRIELGTHTFTAQAIKTFAAQYDPQAFHMDEAAAARSHFGALCASGWHTVAAWMNLRVQYGRHEDAERAARGEVIAKLGPSPGFRELKWLKPVYVGDTISYADLARRIGKPIRVPHRGVHGDGDRQCPARDQVIDDCGDGIDRDLAIETFARRRIHRIGHEILCAQAFLDVGKKMILGFDQVRIDIVERQSIVCSGFDRNHR